MKREHFHSWWHWFFVRERRVADVDHTYFGSGTLRDYTIDWCPICKKDVSSEY